MKLGIVVALREAGLAGAVALALAVPLIGFKIPDVQIGFRLNYRFDWVAIGVIAVAIGRFLLVLWYQRAPRARTRGQAGPAGASKSRSGARLEMRAVVALTLAALALPALPFADRGTIEIGITILIYVMLGWGLNVVVGLAGLLDLGYVAFYAVGAYTYALLAVQFDLSFWASLPLAGAFAALFGILLGFPVLRLRGDYLAIVTLGFGEIVREILVNWKALSGGSAGIASIPRPSFFGYPFERAPEPGVTSFHMLFGLEFSSLHRTVFLYYLILVLAIATNVFTMRIRRLPLGRAWEALREDEIACRSLGINPTNAKLSAFAIGAMFAGLAGAFFSTKQGFISPESFTFIESAIVLAIVVLGGMGSQLGVIVASLFLILTPYFARELADFRMLAFGLAMVMVMVWRPQGLITRREPSVRLPQAGGAPRGAPRGAL